MDVKLFPEAGEARLDGPAPRRAEDIADEEDSQFGGF
jgi:hypothetical protein